MTDIMNELKNLRAEDHSRFFSLVRMARYGGREARFTATSPGALMQASEIVASVTWFDEVPDVEEIAEFLYPPRRKFYLDDLPSEFLEAVDSGITWNGFAVPSPTLNEIADYMYRVSDMLPHDECVELFATLMEAYGGSNFASSGPYGGSNFASSGPDEMRTHKGLTWMIHNNKEEV